MTVPAIYQIQSQIHPERIYIGSAIYYKNRWADHKRRLGLGTHTNSKLQNHVNKYGVSDLVFSIIEPCFPEFLIIKEQYYLDKLKPYFNICKTAGSTLGRKMSEETKRKVIEGNKGKKVSEEAKQKIRIAMIGRYVSPATRRKRSESTRGIKSHRYGKTMPEWHRQLISKANKGRKLSKEICLSRSLRLKGKTPPCSTKGLKMSDETKRKISESNIGKVAWNKGLLMSLKQKQKLKEVWIRRKAKIIASA